MISTITAAEILGVSRRRVNSMCASGRLRARQDGRYWIINRADLAGVEKRKAGRPVRV